MPTSRRRLLSEGFAASVAASLAPLAAFAQARGVSPGDPEVLRLTRELLAANCRNAGMRSFDVSVIESGASRAPWGSIPDPIRVSGGFSSMARAAQGGEGFVAGVESSVGRMIDTVDSTIETLSGAADLLEKIAGAAKKAAEVMERIAIAIDNISVYAVRFVAAFTNVVVSVVEGVINVLGTVAEGAKKIGSTIVGFFKKILGGGGGGIVATVDIDGDGQPDGTIFDFPLDAAYTVMRDAFGAVMNEPANLAALEMRMAFGSGGREYLAASRVSVDGLEGEQAILMTA